MTPTEKLVAVVERVRFATATTPFWITLEFIPVSMQVYVPALPAQEVALPAAVAAEPAVTLIAETEDAG